MWNIFKVNNKDTRTTPLVWIYFTLYSSVSIVNFEKVNTDRVVQDLLSNPSLQKLNDTFNSFILRINTKKQMWCFARFCTICTLKKNTHGVTFSKIAGFNIRLYAWLFRPVCNTSENNMRFRSSRRRCAIKKSFSEKFRKIHRKTSVPGKHLRLQLFRKETLVQVFPCEFCEVF